MTPPPEGRSPWDRPAGGGADRGSSAASLSGPQTDDRARTPQARRGARGVLGGGGRGAPDGGPARRGRPRAAVAIVSLVAVIELVAGGLLVGTWSDRRGAGTEAPRRSAAPRASASDPQALGTAAAPQAVAAPCADVSDVTLLAAPTVEDAEIIDLKGYLTDERGSISREIPLGAPHSIEPSLTTWGAKVSDQAAVVRLVGQQLGADAYSLSLVTELPRDPFRSTEAGEPARELVYWTGVPITVPVAIHCGETRMIPGSLRGYVTGGTGKHRYSLAALLADCEATHAETKKAGALALEAWQRCNELPVPPVTSPSVTTS